MPELPQTSTTTQAPVAGRYWVDPDRTTVTVAARHMFGLGRVTGTVALQSAALVVTDPISATRLHARLDATSFDTGSPSRDRAVRSVRYLDTDAHPEISLDADVVRKNGSVVTGTSSLTGRPRPRSCASRMSNSSTMY